MNGDKTIELATHQARHEHVELHHLLEATRQQLGACAERPDAGSAACVCLAIKNLRDHVREHFAHEEKGGWLEEAVVRAPHLAHQLTALEHQHKPLRERCDHLVTMAETSDGSALSIGELRNLFEAFAHSLLMHEANEERVLQKGFNEDLDLA